MSHSPATGGAARAADHAGARQWLRRMRLERQLHDGASLRISALSLRLGLLRGHSADEDFQHSVGELQDELHAVLEELREVAGEIYPPLLDQAGLGPALRELADGAALAVTLHAGVDRFGAAVEGAAYFAVADVLAAMDRSAAGPIAIVIRRSEGQLVLSLTGPPACHAELMADHVRPMGGSVEITAGTSATPVTADEPGGGTITVRIPCE